MEHRFLPGILGLDTRLETVRRKTSWLLTSISIELHGFDLELISLLRGVHNRHVDGKALID